MEFLGIGYQEVGVILVLLLVFVGPERLPHVAYQLGKAVKTMQGYARAVRDEFGDEISYLEEQYQTVRGEVNSVRGQLREETAKLDAEMRDATAELREATAPLQFPVNTANGTAFDTAINPPALEAPLSAEPAPPAPEEPKAAPLLF